MPSYCKACESTLEKSDSTCVRCGASRPTPGWPRDSRIGTKVIGGQYRILRRIGSGGFGVVYEVATIIGDLRRALKVLDKRWASDNKVKERFVNEALVLERVNHPHVARCFAAGTISGGGRLYLLLELIDGIQLDRLVAPALAPIRAVKIAKQIASGLAAAHSKGVLHRDLKPQNILVTQQGEADESVKVIDFGISKMLDSGPTETSTIVGTPQYMAPEQFTPGASFDERLDLWQLGANLFFMLTGRPPYQLDSGEQNPFALLSLHDRHQKLGPVPEIAEGPLPRPLEDLTSALLASDPNNRPRSANEVCEELARIEHSLAPNADSTTSISILEALCSEPNEVGWWALGQYLQSLNSKQSRLVDAASELLEPWPIDLRRAPCGWWEDVKRNRPRPLWKLARSVDLSARGLTDADVEDLANNPRLASIRRLVLSDNELSNQAVEALRKSPFLVELRELDLSGNRLTSAACESLAAGPALRSVRWLSLAHNGIGARGARALSASQLRLEYLDLAMNEIGSSGAAALADMPGATHLTALDLSSNEIGADGLAAIMTSRTVKNLRSLAIANNGIGPGGIAAISVSSHTKQLEHLDVSANRLGDRGLELLFASAGFEALEHLDVSSNEIGAAGVMIFSSSPRARRLQTLELADNRLSATGFGVLMGASQLSSLRTLGVSQNTLGAPAAALLSGSHFKLDSLDFSDNQLDGEGAAALAESLHRMSSVNALKVAGCGLDGGNLEQIVKTSAGRLRQLSVAGNQLGPTGIAELTRPLEFGAIEDLCLDRTQLGSAGIKAFLAAQHLNSLRILSVSSNRIGDQGAAELCRSSLRLPNLEALILRDNHLGFKAAAMLASSPAAARLVRLDLSDNRLGDNGVEALSQCPSWHSLRELDLSNNQVSLGAAAAILSAPATTSLYRLKLAHNALDGLVDLHSLATDRVDLLEQNFGLLARNGADFAERFYDQLFALYPTIKPLFARVSMTRQRQHLMSALVMTVDNLRAPDSLTHSLNELGRRHIGYGVSPSHYYAVSQVLLDTIRHFSGDAWSEELQQAWSDGLDAITSVMMQAHFSEHLSGIRTPTSDTTQILPRPVPYPN